MWIHRGGVLQRIKGYSHGTDAISDWGSGSHCPRCLEADLSEEIPWLTHTTWEGDQLVVERSLSESGNVYVPWNVLGHGGYLLATSTLRERPEPYLLEVELARGLIHRIRNRLFVWEWQGMKTPADLQTDLTQATRLFSRSATLQQADAVEAISLADQALSTALKVAEDLAASYAQQSLDVRQRQTPVSTLMGVTLGNETPSVQVRRSLLEACNIIQLPIAWRAIELKEGRRDWKQTDQQLAWCQKAGLKTSAGPLLQMDDRGAPDWLYLWEGDYDSLSRLMLEHVQAVVSRYAGRVHMWHVASRVNHGPLFSLEEEQRLQLVAQALELVRKLDPRTPTVVSFDQPWAEYLGNEAEDLAPMHYADALVRADLGISGFGLEINAGFHPGGSQHRPAFEYDRLIEQWSQFGLPLMLQLSTASSAQPDALASRGIEVTPPIFSGDTTADQQHAWAGALLPLLLSRSSVQVVMWNPLTDATQHEFPNAGLYDAKQQAKPVLHLMRDLHKACLT